MKKLIYRLSQNLHYLCLMGVVTLGLTAIVGSNGGVVTTAGGGGSILDTTIDYRQEMRDFVQGISIYAKGLKAGFIIIPQNGHELLTEDGRESGTPASTYLNSIDGVGREDLFYGYDNDNEATPESERDYMLAFMDIAENNDVEVLVTDYC
jgi:uncharacterized protein (TIGR01370 family)